MHSGRSKCDYCESIIILFFLLLYLAGANANSSLDAWAYAAEVSSGTELFQPHHLLYSFVSFLWTSLVKVFFDIDVLVALKGLNAIFGASILLVLSKLLNKARSDRKLNLLLLFFAGSCWGFMRYSTENETYILPIFFSLLGSYLLVKESKIKYVFWAGFFAALATLFHQVMFFWWLGLLLGVMLRQRLKGVILFTLPTLIVPLVYSTVVFFKYGKLSIDLLLQFVFYDYYNGTASIEFGAKSGMLFIIGICRSFIQVHGYIFNLLNENYWYWFVAIGSILAVCSGLAIITLRMRYLSISKPHLLWIYSFITLSHLGFAMLAGGNSEFMVMLPILATIVIACFKNISKTAVGIAALGVLMWNIGFGIIPLKYKKLDGSSMIVNHIEFNSSEKSAYILFNSHRIKNELHYKNINSQATLIKLEELEQQVVRDSINYLLDNGYCVYTDALRRPKTISRESITIDRDKYIEVLNCYKKVPTDSVNTLTGEYFLTRLTP